MSLFLESIKVQERLDSNPKQPRVVESPTKKPEISEQLAGVVLRHRKRGMTYKEISKDLNLAYHTVYNVCRRSKHVMDQVELN